MKKRWILIPLFIISCTLNTAWACDYCIASQGISPVELGSTGIRYDFRYLHLGSIFKGSTKIENPQGMEETFVTHQIGFNYRPVDALTISLLVPFSSRSSIVTYEALAEAKPNTQSPQHHVNDHPVGSEYLQGLADIIALAKYRVLDEMGEGDDPLTLVVNAGLKLPTGKTNAVDVDGRPIDPHLQLGSGSMDFIAGLSVLKGLDDWTLVTTLLGIFPTEGANGYRYGANLNYDLGVRYRFIDEEGVSGSLFGSMSFVGELRGMESKDGVTLDDTGGNTTYIAPGAVYFVTKRISVEASYQYPFLHNLNGTQLGETYRIVAGAQYLF